MKRFLIMFVAVFALIVLTACGEKEFAYDGTFLAFEYGESLEVTTVSVTIEKGKIKGFYIDSVQSKRTKGEDDKYSSAWNPKSKKELGYFYGMHFPDAGTGPITEANLETYKTWLKDNNKLEWFEQVEIIAKDVINNGKDSTVDKTAGVTITTTNYYQLITKLFEYKK